LKCPNAADVLFRQWALTQSDDKYALNRQLADHLLRKCHESPAAVS